MSAVTDAVMDQLARAGYMPYVVSCRAEGECLRGTMRTDALVMLRGDERFASGVFWTLHQDVGEHLIDFRSYTGAFGKGSLQLVLDKETGAFYADVDLCNPYQDVVNACGHFFVEVIPGWAGSAWRWLRRRT